MATLKNGFSYTTPEGETNFIDIVLDGKNISDWNNKADKQTPSGGFAGGLSASTDTGGAIGNGASAEGGGAVGEGAKTSNGFAGGQYAKTVNSFYAAIDAIQLGTGTNSNEKTLQVYEYQLMDATGKIPADRLPDGIAVNSPNTALGVCNTALDESVKEISITKGSFNFEDGDRIAVDFKNGLKAPSSGTIKIKISGHDTEYNLFYNGVDTLDSLNEKYLTYRYIDIVFISGSYTNNGAFMLPTTDVVTHAANSDFAYDIFDTIDQSKVSNLTTDLDSKADKQTVGGGFLAGQNSSVSGSGIAIGNTAKVFEGSGIAIGSHSKSVDGGFAIGNSTSCTGNATAVGDGATSVDGTAIGYNANASSDTIAIGRNAKATKYDAIQLGGGTNSTEGTLQVYSYQLMDANGQIPKDRMTNALNTALSDHANIKKNSASTSGDIISSHLTIGTRASNNIYGSQSLTSGTSNTATSSNSVSVGGQNNNAKAIYSANVGGTQNTISASYSANVGGSQNTISAKYSANFGGLKNNVSAEKCATIGGEECSVSSPKSVTVGGNKAKITGWCSNTLGGSEITAQNFQVVAGHLNKIGTDNAGSSGTNGDAFIIGNGASDTSRSNAFRVTYAGGVYALSSFKSTGADYGEYFEWEDGNSNNEDRRGLFVTLNGNKIKLANDDDYILGVISANASIIGNTYDDTWQGMYKTDVFGAPLTQIIHHDDEYGEIIVPDKDEDGNELETTHTEQILIRKAYDSEEYILNPDYDSSQEYMPRSQRKEWAVVGLIGQLVVVDDGSCYANGYCKVGKNGIATMSSSGYRVLSRLDENHIKIYVK